MLQDRIKKLNFVVVFVAGGDPNKKRGRPSKGEDQPAPGVHNNPKGASISVKVGSGKQAASRTGRTAKVMSIDAVQSVCEVDVAERGRQGAAKGKGVVEALSASKFRFLCVNLCVCLLISKHQVHVSSPFIH
jgi:hypothetical protein